MAAVYNHRSGRATLCVDPPKLEADYDDDSNSTDSLRADSSASTKDEACDMPLVAYLTDDEDEASHLWEDWKPTPLRCSTYDWQKYAHYNPEPERLSYSYQMIEDSPEWPLQSMQSPTRLPYSRYVPLRSKCPSGGTFTSAYDFLAVPQTIPQPESTQSTPYLWENPYVYPQPIKPQKRNEKKLTKSNNTTAHRSYPRKVDHHVLNHMADIAQIFVSARSNINSLAAVIIYRMKDRSKLDFTEYPLVLQCIGRGAIHQACLAIAVANRWARLNNVELLCEISGFHNTRSVGVNLSKALESIRGVHNLMLFSLYHSTPKAKAGAPFLVSHSTEPRRLCELIKAHVTTYACCSLYAKGRFCVALGCEGITRTEYSLRQTHCFAKTQDHTVGIFTKIEFANSGNLAVQTILFSICGPILVKR